MFGASNIMCTMCYMKRLKILYSVSNIIFRCSAYQTLLMNAAAENMPCEMCFTILIPFCKFSFLIDCQVPATDDTIIVMGVFTPGVTIKDINLVKFCLLNCLTVLSVSYTHVWISYFCDIQSVLAEFNISNIIWGSVWPSPCCKRNLRCFHVFVFDPLSNF